MKKRFEVGDKIARLHKHGGSAVSILTVTRVTETLAVCKKKALVSDKEYEIKFPREVNDGACFTEKGASGWNKDYYTLAVDEHYKQIYTAKIRHKIAKTEWGTVPVEKLEEIQKILAE